MSSSSLVFISIALSVLILPVQSVYNVYSYDDGNGGEEHCCIARIRENFCLATPITRSLVQVNKQCYQLDRPKRRRFGGKMKRNQYLEKISRRLDVQSSEEIGDKILLELETPLETNMVQNDLVCLTSTDHNMNLDKCYLELVDESENDNSHDDDDDKESERRGHHKHREYRRRHHHHHRDRHDRIKRIVHENDAAEEDNSVMDDNTKVVDTEARKEMNRVELQQPIRVREGHGLSIRKTYTLNVTHIRQTSRQQQQCISWYRKQTRKTRHNPSKHRKSCQRLDDHHETCINHLVFNDPERSQHTLVSLPSESKLYCEDQSGFNKLLGVYRQGNICFEANEQIIIEQTFSDIAGLSDVNKNKDILRMIANHKKFKAEFEHDCHDQQTLVEFEAADREFRPHANHNKSKRH